MAIDFDALVLAPAAAIFGEAFVFSPPDKVIAPGGAVTGIFFDGYVNKVLADDGAPGFISSDPAVDLRAALFSAPPAQNDQITRVATGQTYLINEPQPDGVGNITLQLNEIA